MYRGKAAFFFVIAYNHHIHSYTRTLVKPTVHVYFSRDLLTREDASVNKFTVDRMLRSRKVSTNYLNLISRSYVGFSGKKISLFGYTDSTIRRVCRRNLYGLRVIRWNFWNSRTSRVILLRPDCVNRLGGILYITPTNARNIPHQNAYLYRTSSFVNVIIYVSMKMLARRYEKNHPFSKLVFCEFSSKSKLKF